MSFSEHSSRKQLSEELESSYTTRYITKNIPQQRNKLSKRAKHSQYSALHDHSSVNSEEESREVGNGEGQSAPLNKVHEMVPGSP